MSYRAVLTVGGIIYHVHPNNDLELPLEEHFYPVFEVKLIQVLSIGLRMALNVSHI